MNILPILVIFAAGPLDASVIMRAMNDELSRSMAELAIAGQPKPYYLGYRVNDCETIEIQAVLGGLIRRSSNKSRDVYVDLRLGDYSFDNSNFVCPLEGSGFIESDATNLVLDDDYDAIRQTLWLVTDGTYKKALEKLSRKKASIQNRPRRDSLTDFSIPPVTVIDQPAAFADCDLDRWAEVVTGLSRVFLGYPRISESSVMLRIVRAQQFFLDSEGNRSRCPRPRASIEVLAKARSTSGEPLEDFISFCVPTVADFPASEAIAGRIAAMAETLSQLTMIKNEEPYSGPVLFVGQAAAEFFFQTLARGAADPRTPLYENERLGQRAGNEFGFLAGKLERRIMPEFISAYDDPAMESFQGVPLVGSYRVDEQGVAGQRVEIVKHGKLANLYMSRAPVKKIKESNGHGFLRQETYGYRYAGIPGTLVIDPERSTALAAGALKQRLIELGRESGASCGIIVSRLAETRPLSPSERIARYYGGGESDQPLLSAPLVAYRVDLATGETSLINGLEFAGVTSRVLRDIAAIGDSSYVHNLLYRDDRGNTYPVSVVAPAVLVEELDLVTKETKPGKPPVLKNPLSK